MTFYRIRDWAKHFENNRTRELKYMDWVPVPNKHDGDGFTELLDHPEGLSHYGAWHLILQVASKCEIRGTLLRDGAAGGKRPHTPESLARITRGDEKTFKDAIDRLVSIGWIEVCNNPSLSCDNPAPSCGEVTTERNGTERNGTELNGIYHPNSRTALYFLNEACGKHFRELDSNLKVISARLSEPEVTLEGVKQMIVRQCKRWKGTPQEEYLRPETLFGKTKFDSYYASRELPIHTDDHGTSNRNTGRSPQTNPRNIGVCPGTTDYAAAVKKQQQAHLATQVAKDQGDHPAASQTGGPGI
jgi:uncharacterized phage protein (TIGR02220 family)